MYWVEISRQEKFCGAGFLLTRRYVLTAFHCIRGAGQDEGPLDLKFASGEMTQGRLHEYVPEADLALISLLKPIEGDPRPPNPDRGRAGDPWSAPYRPSPTDPHLSGVVVEGSMTYRCESGGDIRALQLSCTEELGSYSGYSGGPVERRSPGKETAVLGLLVEQYPDRHAPSRASNVLFAASIAEALRRFDSFDVHHLMDVLRGEDESGAEKRPDRTAVRVPEPVPASASSPDLDGSLGQGIKKADALLRALNEWGDQGVLDPIYISSKKRHVVDRLIERELDNKRHGYLNVFAKVARSREPRRRQTGR